MWSTVSLAYHTFTRQALSSKGLTSIVHIHLPETDNCLSWISRGERMTVENISWSISNDQCCWVDGVTPITSWSPAGCASNWATKTGLELWLTMIRLCSCPGWSGLLAVWIWSVVFLFMMLLSCFLHILGKMIKMFTCIATFCLFDFLSGLGTDGANTLTISGSLSLTVFTGVVDCCSPENPVWLVAVLSICNGNFKLQNILCQSSRLQFFLIFLWEYGLVYY